MGEGDWVCSDSNCANINFARRTHCNRCGAEKSDALNKRKLGHEIGKAAAAKSHGLFSADDWQCSKCGNVNWARRQQCNVCNAPRFGDVEERTGLGGGYNDRGVVEYKQRDDSEDEYDEFGRRRKKFRKDEKSNGNGSPENDQETVSEVKEDLEKEIIEEKVQDNKDDSDQKKPKDKEETEEEEEEEEEEDDGDLSNFQQQEISNQNIPPKMSHHSIALSKSLKLTGYASIILFIGVFYKYGWKPFINDKRYNRIQEDLDIIEGKIKYEPDK